MNDNFAAPQQDIDVKRECLLLCVNLSQAKRWRFWSKHWTPQDEYACVEPKDGSLCKLPTLGLLPPVG